MKSGVNLLILRIANLYCVLLTSVLQQGSIGSGGSSSSSSGNTEEGPLDAMLTSHFTNAGVAVLEAPKDGQSQHSDRSKRYIVEHVDLGAYYYRKYFYLRGEQKYGSIVQISCPRRMTFTLTSARFSTLELPNTQIEMFLAL